MIEVIFRADSQEEFDQKRSDIIKALIGSNGKVPRRPRLKAQGQLHAQADSVFKHHMKEAKNEIEEMLSIMLPEGGEVAPVKLENL